MKNVTRALFAAGAALLVAASPALAQFKPRPLNDPATGELFHIEADAGFWNPTATMTISSESLGIPGSVIDQAVTGSVASSERARSS